LEKYKQGLMTDKEFAKRDEEKCQAEKERVNRKNMDWQNRKQRDEDMNILFENFFGENRIWGPIADSYWKKYYSRYMPIGNGRFLHEHAILRKENLYETGSSKSNDNRRTGDIMVPIRDPLQGCSLVFGEGEVLPQKSDNFDAWYKRLPIHKMFLQGKESEIHFLAPDNEQPDFPFVYVNLNVDCELSEEEDNEEDEKNTITKNIT
jgi:hypothetical protein